jgi:hypothetical protein
MNAQAIELYKQALEFAYTTIGKDHADTSYFQGTVAGKFAELIVGECLKIAKNREDEFESAGLLEQSNAVGNVAYRISRQFGVKR